MRAYNAKVPFRAEGMTLGAYAAMAFPLLPAHVLREAFAARDVKMDGKRAEKNAAAVPGASVTLYTGFDAALPAVYEDERVLILNKPAGISCCDDDWGGMTVLSLARERYGAGARLCHRLDNQTSGLLLMCFDDESEGLATDAFRSRRLTKIYQCLVKGQLRPPAAIREAFLVKDAEQARVRIVSHETPGALPIATQYETMAFDENISRLRVTLLTGRTHQIRAHMSFLSHPILGDDKYGDRAFNKRMKARSLMLCATELTLYPGGALKYLDGKTFTVAPPF